MYRWPSLRVVSQEERGQSEQSLTFESWPCPSKVMAVNGVNVEDESIDAIVELITESGALMLTRIVSDSALSRESIGEDRKDSRHWRRWRLPESSGVTVPENMI